MDTLGKTLNMAALRPDPMTLRGLYEVAAIPLVVGTPVQLIGDESEAIREACEWSAEDGPRAVWLWDQDGTECECIGVAFQGDWFHKDE